MDRGWVFAACLGVACGPSADGDSGGDDGGATTQGDAPLEVCTEASLSPSAMAVVTEDPGDDDGRFTIRISTAFDWCTASGTWAGWDVDVTFLHGRPGPGEYPLGDDEQLISSGTYAESKVEGLPTELDGASLQIVDLEADGTVSGVLCNVQLTTYDDPLSVQGSFTALPCG